MAELTLVLAGSTGGIGAHVKSLTAGLCARGHGVQVLAPDSTHRLFDFAAAGARLGELPLGEGAEPLAVLKAARSLREQATGSLLHAHGLRAGLVSGLALGSRSPQRTPLVCTWHNALLTSGARRRIDEALQRLVARRSDVTLGASADLVATALRSGAPDARLGEVAAPRLTPPARTVEQVRAELGILGPLVLCVARLHPQKRLDVLVAAAGLLAASVPDVTVAVAGEGPQRSELERLVAQTGAPVRLLGRRADVSDLLHAADAAVISSDWEARALVAQEALLAGVPLVATAVGGVPELVGGGADLVPAGDAAALAAALSRVLTDPDHADRVRAEGRRRAAQWPDEDDVVRTVEQVYDELLRGRS